MLVPSPACQNVLIYFLFSMTHSNSNPSSLLKRILSQFATYRSAISRVAFLTTFLVISFLASLPEVSRAQVTCPTGWSGPTSWAYTMWCGTGITVWWCDSLNNSTNTDRRLIEEIDIASDSSGCTDDIAIIWSADSAVMDYPLGPHICGTSGSGYNIQSVMQACCWSPAYIPGQKSLLPCATENFEGYCVYTCDVCRTLSGGIVTTNCSTTTIGFPPSCALPPPGNNFSLSQCYVVGCNSND
jgi:hypothetical protein